MFMGKLLDSYRLLLGSETVDRISQIASTLKKAKVVHVNSTKEGGGVAEILSSLVPLMEDLEIDVEWKVIHGEPIFFQCTKTFHNLMQGQKKAPLPSAFIQAYKETNKKNAEALQEVLQNADFVFIHDPQPLALISYIPNRKGKWIWRCHIDLSSPNPPLWQFLKKFAASYEASIFSMKDYIQKLPHPSYVVPPGIDPLSEKNKEMEREEIVNIFSQFKIAMNRPTLLQVSRFDKYKDPIGVIKAFRLAKKKYPDLQLILAGGGASDDSEGDEMLKNVYKSAANDPDIYILFLPPNAHRIINALQRGATIVIQKSLKEGFGLTVTEALWKAKPVIGGNTGGIRLQVIDGQTGFLVNTPQEAAERIDYFLQHLDIAQGYGKRGKQLVKEKFLITRQLTDYLNILAEL